jgi:nucleoside-diphosphate-sugar epimerase
VSAPIDGFRFAGLPCGIKKTGRPDLALIVADRVVPAFARAAATGAPLRIDGAGHTFDFTHIDDTARGLAALIDHLDRNPEPPPPIHLLTGRPTTLGQLAALAIELAGTRSPLHDAPPRNFDVARFDGDPTRASALLDWSPRVALRDGLARLIKDFRANSIHEVSR